MYSLKESISCRNFLKKKENYSKCKLNVCFDTNKHISVIINGVTGELLMKGPQFKLWVKTEHEYVKGVFEKRYHDEFVKQQKPPPLRSVKATHDFLRGFSIFI